LNNNIDDDDDNNNIKVLLNDRISYKLIK